MIKPKIKYSKKHNKWVVVFNEVIDLDKITHEDKTKINLAWSFVGKLNGEFKRPPFFSQIFDNKIQVNSGWLCGL